MVNTIRHSIGREASSPFPPGGGRLGCWEKLGITAVLRRTPTPPSPVEGEGAAPRRTALLVPHCIGGRLATWSGGIMCYARGCSYDRMCPQTPEG
jgi:hypothetical protein